MSEREKFNPNVVRAHYLNNIDRLMTESRRLERNNIIANSVLNGLFLFIVVIFVISAVCS